MCNLMCERCHLPEFFGREYNYQTQEHSSVDENVFFRQIAHAGDSAIDFTLPSVDGETITLSELHGKPVIIEFGALTCVSCQAEFPLMDDIAREFANEAHHLFVYTRETHPEHNPGVYEHFESYEEKLARARLLQERWNTPRTILVDDLEGTVHRRYAGVSNQSWVIDHTGHIAHKAAWTIAADIRYGLELALRTRELKRTGTAGSTYYRELFTFRPSDTRTKEESLRLVRQGPDA